MKFIPIHIAVLNSIAPMLCTATVFPSKCMPTSVRNTKLWQASTIRESIAAQSCSLHWPKPVASETNPIATL